MIRLNEVSLCLGDLSGSSSVQFHLPAFEVAEGETVALTGPSGCGKSTLLNLVAGLRRADEGEVSLAGVDLANLSPAALDRHRGAHCGMVFQTFHLLAPFTALENVAIGLRFGARKRLNGGPSLLLADEPTGSLDPETGREIFDLLRDIAIEDGCTLLMVTHDSALAAELPVNFDCSGLVRSIAISHAEEAITE